MAAPTIPSRRTSELCPIISGRLNRASHELLWPGYMRLYLAKLKIDDQDSLNVEYAVGVGFGDFPIAFFGAQNKVVHQYAPRMAVECVCVCVSLSLLR